MTKSERHSAMKRVLANVPDDVLAAVAGTMATVGDADAMVVVADAIRISKTVAEKPEEATTFVGDILDDPED